MKQSSLPPKEVFYGKLNMADIRNQDYSHAQAVWTEFSIRNLGEYHDLYLQTDVILLTYLRRSGLPVYGIMVLIRLISIVFQDWRGKLV